ncbi:MAG TPA: lysophospholipid acyltransferase family protein [Candidatus Angelobacter sp.]|nr:lysophospholipid acyltransferase family protein [Candidatus Angelobacter sp.]HKR95855.1 lysophospholipid acyltransferase family protein [Candidatus Angelobacter sp.]
MSAVSASIIAACARTLAGPSVRWVNCRPSSRQRVYFANHTSHLDFVVLWSVLPRRLREKTRPVAAKDYWNSGIRKRIAVNAFHAVLVERGSKIAEGDRMAAARHTLDMLLEAMGEKNSLIVFPEGTRGNGVEVGPFKSGIYYLWSKRPDVQFVPVYLSNLNRILPKGEFLPVPVISRVTFGAPLRPDANETKDSFLAKAHEAVCALRDA